MIYCPECKSRIYPVDQSYMLATGVCSYCVQKNDRLMEQHRIFLEDIKKCKREKSLRKQNKA